MVVDPWLLNVIDDPRLALLDDLNNEDDGVDGSEEVKDRYCRISEKSSRSVEENRLWVVGVAKDTSDDDGDRTRLVGVDKELGGMVRESK